VRSPLRPSARAIPPDVASVDRGRVPVKADLPHSWSGAL
jgi:hypothetical protein